jgi:O-antigen/teichoic acid export membrane protein
MSAMSIAYGGIVAFLFRGLNAAVAFSIIVLTKHQLGTSDFGAFGIGLTVIGIVTATTGGMTAAAAYQVSNQHREPGTIFANGIVPSASLTALGIIAGFVAAAVLSGDAADAAIPVSLAGGAIVLNSVVTGVFLGRGAFVRYNVALVSPPFFSLCAILIVFFVLDAHSPQAALASYAVGQWLAFAAAMVYGHRVIGRELRFELPLAKSMVRFTLVAAVSSVVSYLAYRGDQFIVLKFEGKEGVGTYLLAVLVAESVWQVSGSLALATYARVGAATRDEAVLLTTRVMRHTVLLLAVVCTTLFLAADLIGSFVFTNDGMATPLRLLLPGVLLYSLGVSFSAFYTYQRGLPWVSAAIAAIGLVIDLSLAFVLVPVMGINGAALASTIAYSTAIVAGLAVFMRQERISPAQIFRFGRADLDDYRMLLGRIRDLLRQPAQAAPLR